MSTLVFLGFFSSNLSGQMNKYRSPETGEPHIINYGPSDFNAPEATWGAIQDERGITYVGNQAGILEFDGETWKLIPTPRKTYVRSFAKDPQTGRIYAGSLGDFGYLAPDAKGEMQFVSIPDKHPELDRRFSDIWSTVWTPEGVYFLAHEGLFRFDPVNDTVKFWKAEKRFSYASYIRGVLYLSDSSTGLKKLAPGDAEPTAVPGFEQFASARRLVLAPYGPDKILVVSRGSDQLNLPFTPLWLYDGRTVTPMHTESDALLKENRMISVDALPDGSFAIGTSGGGFVVIDPDGRIIWQVNELAGLRDDTVYGVYFNPAQKGPDRRVLWVTGSSGISRVELPPPLSLFRTAIDPHDPHAKPKLLKGTKLNFVRFAGSLYAGTSRGAYRLNAGEGKIPQFQLVERTGTQQITSMVTVQGPGKSWLLLGTAAGLYQVHDDRADDFIIHTGTRPYAVTAMYVSKLDPSRVFIGLEDGLASVRVDANGKWIDEGTFHGPHGFRSQSVVEDDLGRIWIGTEASGVVEVDAKAAGPNGVPDRNAAYHEFPLKVAGPNGKPETLGGGLRLFRIGHRELFASTDLSHLYELKDEASGLFEELTDASRSPLAPLAGVRSDSNLRGFGFQEDEDGNVWGFRGKEVVFLEKKGDTYERRTAFPPTLGNFSAAFFEKGGVSWFGTLEYVVRYDRAQALAGAQGAEYGAKIRSITVTSDAKRFKNQDESTRVVYGGAGPLSDGKFSSSERKVRFTFSAVGAADNSQLMYETTLDGVGSSTRQETFVEYPGLRPGSYKFHVKAINPNGAEEGEEDTYTFSIAAPWYWTWWSKTIYALLFLGALWAFVVLRTRRAAMRERERSRVRTQMLQDQADALKQKVEEATREIRKQAEDLQHAYDTVESLSTLGREITATLDLDAVLYKVYESVSKLADASVFGVAILDVEHHRLEYPLAMLRGTRLEGYSKDTDEKHQFAVWCIENRQPVIMNDVQQESSRYIDGEDRGLAKMAEGDRTTYPQSMIYLPLMMKDHMLGVITLQSFQKNAYSEYHLELLKSLASYTSIAISNARLFQEAAHARTAAETARCAAEAAQQAAEAADASKSAFLSTVSHELRTPLTSVMGFAKIIRRRLSEKLFPLIPPDPKTAQTMKQVTDNLDVVVSEGERLTRLIDDVLDLAKIEAGKLEWRMESLTATEIIERAHAATSSLTENKPVSVVVDVEPDLPHFIGDRNRLIQVVINLISNAVKFTTEGTITCRARRVGEELVIGVTDTGLGIAEADQPKVFEKFKQVGDTLTDKPKGTGLGLPICKEIVEHHQGRIWVESELGKGSTFFFSLPAAAETAPPAEAPAAAAPEFLNLEALVRRLRASMDRNGSELETESQTILVVDDDANIRELLRQELHDAGYLVRLASDGPEALNMVRDHRPGLVLLDVLMPEMNGFDVAAILRNDPATADIPIIMLSIVHDEERGHRLGIDRYLTKPVDVDLLLKEADTLMTQGKSKKKVMIVDEDASAVKSMMEVLQLRGFQVIEGGGTDLVEKAVSAKPDVIILNSVFSGKAEIMKTLRFEKGLENLLFLIY